MGVIPATSKTPIKNVMIEKRNTMLKLDFPAILIGMISFVLINCKKTKIDDTKITNGNNEYNISGVFNNDINSGKKIFEYEWSLKKFCSSNKFKITDRHAKAKDTTRMVFK